MNYWYMAAIIFGTITAFCAYYGSIVEGRRSSQEQTSRIETQLQSLGTQIQELRLGSKSSTQSEKIHQVDEQYRGIAEEFFRTIPLRKAHEEVRTAKQQVEEIQKTQEIETYFRAIGKEAEKFAAAYNRAAGHIVLELHSNPVPENLFRPTQDHPAYILLKIQSSKYWAVRIVSYPDRTFAIQFVRLLSPDGSSNYTAMHLTNDSINFVLLKDQFGISLNQSISNEVRANVIGDISLSRQPMDKFIQTSTELTRKIIEYELLPVK